MDEKSLLVQIEQKDKAYATLMDQFNKLQAEKNNLQAELKIAREKNARRICGSLSEDLAKEISDLQEQCSIRYEVIEKLNGEKKQLEEVIKDRTKDVQHYDEENKKLTEMLNISEKAREATEKELKELQVDNEWRSKALNEVDTKYRRLSVLIGEFVRQAVEL